MVLKKGTIWWEKGKVVGIQGKGGIDKPINFITFGKKETRKVEELEHQDSKLGNEICCQILY